MPISTINQNGLNAPLTLTSPTLSGTTIATTVTSPAATALTLQSAGTTAVTISTAQNVGIGTSSPTGKLDVSSSSAGVTAGDLVVDTANKTVYVGRQSSTGGDNSYLVVRGRVNGSGTNQAIAITGDTTAYGTGLFRPNNDMLGFSTLATERMRIDSSGNLFYASTSLATSKSNGVSFNQYSGGTYQIIGHGALSITTDAFIQFFVVGTSCGIITQQNGFTVNYGTSSDYRLKENITPITGALAKIAQLKPVTYKWKSDGSNGEGFIAHELQEICPIAVSGQKDAINEDETIKPQQVDPSKLVSLLTAAIQELKAEFDAYKASHP